MISLSQSLRRLLSALWCINPLRFDRFASSTRRFATMHHKFSNGMITNLPKSAKLSITKLFHKVTSFNGIKNISAFNEFNSFYHFIRQTFFHDRYIIVKHKDSTKYNGTVYNLSVDEDESYITKIGITHNCRCLAVEVMASDYDTSNSTDAIEKGKVATTQIGKGGKNKAEMFRFNPGKSKKLFPPDNSYMPKMCGGAKLNITGNIALAKILLTNERERCQAKKLIEKEALKRQRKQKDKELKKWASENIQENNKIRTYPNIKTGKVRITRTDINNIVSHFPNIEDKEMTKDIYKIITECKYIGNGQLDTSKANSITKQKRGVTQYHYYSFTRNGVAYRLNMEVINNNYEKPYAINRIKK